ncbi:MAG: TIGR01777 family oxidoreductase [Rikenellaceae bacterium]
MNIAICGATGCVGHHLSAYLKGVGHTVTPITRVLLTMPQMGNLQTIIDNSDVVINLSGAPISKRWSRANLDKIFNSRIEVTKRLVDIINRSQRPSLFISASAAGYHSSEMLLKPNIKSDTILTKLIDEWEGQARRINSKTRLVITRFSVVFDASRGALPKMLESSGWGFLARIGSGERLLSWIAVDDVAHAIEHIIKRKEVEGAVNFVTPEPTTQEQFLDSAKRAKGVRFIIQLPILLLKILYGRAANVIMHSNYTRPMRLQQMGYKFIHPTIHAYFSQMVE